MPVEDELRSALKQGESATVAFLPANSKRRLTETICAFANTNGGVIYVGVRKRKEGDPPGEFDTWTVSGAKLDRVKEITSDPREYFDGPEPDIQLDEVRYLGSEGQQRVVAVRVSPNKHKIDIALRDRTIWRRRGGENISREARAKSVLQKDLEQSGQDHINLTDRADVEAVPGASLQKPDDIEDAGSDETSEHAERTDAGEDGATQNIDEISRTRAPSSEDEASPGTNGVTVGGSGEDRPGSDSVAPGEPPPVTLVGSRMRIQREAAEPEPSLNADEYADVITDILTDAKDDERMSFALFGHWGRGKTYQIGRVQDRLGAAAEKKKLKYSTVLFSAWKYRTTPEMWAYLFETFLQVGRNTSWSLPFRAAFFRQGPWPLITALFGLFFSLWTLTEQVTLAYSLIQLFGVGAMLYTIFLFTRFQATAIRLKALYSFAGHADKLGLQAAIGTDLRVLLRAWIPRKTWQGQLKSLPILPTLAYVLACGLITWKLFPRTDSTTHAITFPNFNDATVDAYPWIALGAYAVWILLWTIGPFVVLVDWRKAARDRVLLTVDDLDRCEPGQMLDIIESTMLILDDDEVSKRLQVVMLIDESAFQHALLRKYRYLTVRKQELPGHTYTPERIIRENQEKFFLVHLRLSPLSRTEIDDVTGAFVRQLSGSPPKESLSDKIWGNTPSPAPARSTAVDEPEPLTENASDSSTIELSDDPLEPKEIDHLRISVTSETGKHPDHTLGPRAIRCLLFRYQLARGILIKLTQKPDPAELAGKVVKAYFDGQRAPEEADTLLDRVVRQVS